MRFTRSPLLALISVITVLLMSAAASAHHSVAAFDRDNPITVAGTVKEFRWTNPHTWIHLAVPDGNGGEEDWGMEGGAVNMVVRQGWTTDTLKPGMKVKLLVAPRRDGKIGGEWLRLLEIDGKPFESPKAP
jgi:hypothetical protein